MLNWANQFGIFLFVHSGSFQIAPHTYQWQLLIHDTHATPQVALPLLFGHLSYHCAEDVFKELTFAQVPLVDFGKQTMLPAHTRIACKANGEWLIESVTLSQETIIAQIQQTAVPKTTQLNMAFQDEVDKNSYLNTIETIKEHIRAGDCYELNYCVQSVATTNYKLDTVASFLRMLDASPAPMSALYKHYTNYALSLSPERFLAADANRLVMQPIKGTAKRHSDAIIDAQVKYELYQSIKNRAENVMIVDLTRSDLAKIAKPHSVQVEELYGIYTFPKVHQMISTISAQRLEQLSLLDTLKALFPMGSMTGAPKRKVMALINQYEAFNRGLYSGALGFIDAAQQSMDFSVVIRTLLYDACKGILTVSTGGAITIDSEAEDEYAEMQLKGAFLKAFSYDCLAD